MRTAVPTKNDIARRARNLAPYWLFGLIGLVVLTAVVMFVVVSVSNGGSTEQNGTSTAPAVGFADLQAALQRTGVRPEGEAPVVDVFLASPVYYSSARRTPPQAALERPSIVLQIAETIHTGILPKIPPAPILRLDGKSAAKPFYTSVLADSDHHRLTLVAYPLEMADGAPISTSDAKQLQVIFPKEDGSFDAANVLTWDLPIRYTPEFTSSEVVIGPQSAPETAVGLPSFTWADILAIMAGMLVALSPCLLGLGVYYASVLAGAGGEGQPGITSMVVARRHIIQTGIFFSLGFTLVYSSGGAAAGFVGQSLEHLGLLTTWIRPISETAGAIILILAVRVAWNARAPGVCQLPLTPVFGRSRRTGPVSAALMGFTFAGGCLSCFSATVLPALLLYASAVGSVVYGALLLMVFSLGISIPALGLALGVSRSERLLSWLQRNSPKLGLASAAVMVGFGFLMVTYTYHNATGLVGKYLGL